MSTDPSPSGGFKADAATRRRNWLTAAALVLFFVAMITAAVLGPQFFQTP